MTHFKGLKVNTGLLTTLHHTNHPPFLIVFQPAVMLMCLVCPDNTPEEHIVDVKLDNDKTVAYPKKLIRDKHAQSSITLMPVILYSGITLVFLMMVA